MALEDVEQQHTKTIKTWHSSSSSSKSVPMEIIVEILLRLPVESLLRCKSVCKSWRSLISDPHFIKDHLTLSTNNHHYVHHHLLLVCRTGRLSNLKTYPIYNVMYDHNAINPLELDYPMKHPYKEVLVAGSCNGLICIAIEPNNLVIWNPSTRKSIKIPERPGPGSHAVRLRGFGYDESSDDYKVVEITYNFKDAHKNRGMIYSSRTRKWKDLSFPHRIWLYGMNVYLKGALHWIPSKDHGSWIIVSLDLAKETYGEVLLPVDEDVDTDLELGSLRDCLCVLCDYTRISRCCADVWVMKVYGVKDSWLKLVSIRYDQVYALEKCYWGDPFSAPLCVSDDGKVLLLLGSSFVVFDSKNDSSLKIQMSNGCYKGYTFVESLVPP